LIPIEHLRPGNLVYAHDGQPHRLLRVIRKRHSGPMIGIRHAACRDPLWLTGDHYILCSKRTRSYGAGRSWQHVPGEHFGYARELRKDMTPPERRLWSVLRGGQLGAKFRRQHPLGPYIADFYSWQAGLVVEVDGDSHATPAGQEYDAARTRYVEGLGLTELRFTNRDVLQQTSAVATAICNAVQAVQPADDHYREWRRADSLRVGDTVFAGVEGCPREIVSVEQEMADEEVFDLDVEGAHSFITECCIVHEGGSGGLPPSIPPSTGGG